jgi:hypothetical protein
LNKYYIYILQKMKKNLIGKLSVLTIVTCTVAMFSCKKAFDLKPQSAVDISDNYKNVYDANAAVIGIYGKLIGVAEQYVVLNELRADLMDITQNSDKNLVEISQHNVSAGNPWADPRPMYNVIINCNDVLYNLNQMYAANRITAVDYNQRYSDVGAIRSWLYLQLGIHFGTIPYVTDPIADVNDLKDQTKFPRLKFTDLLTKLVDFTSNLPSLDPYSAALTNTNGASTSLITNIDGYNTSYFFINKHFLLGDLYLWQNNYNAAARNYKATLEYPYQQAPGSNYSVYRTSPDQAATNNDLFISYVRYRDQDTTQLVSNNTQGWRSMFSRAQDKLFNDEWMWCMNFDSSFQPIDPFVELYSNSGGKYLVQPSQTAINNWNSFVENNGIPSDARGRLTYNDPTGVYKKYNNQNVIVKNLYVYNDVSITHKYGRWFLQRSATCQLRFAEAANRDGRSKLAYALLNLGVGYVFDSTPGGGTARDVTNTQQTFDVPPYDFDARQGRAPFPFYSADWAINSGIHTRAYLPAYPASAYADVQGLEDKLILESGLETAYEGNRWPDLLRIALRRNDPTFLSSKIFDKLSKDGFGAAAATAQAKLAAGNYYLPFNW